MQFSASQRISGFSTYLFVIAHISYYSIGKDAFTLHIFHTIQQILCKGTFTFRLFSARLITGKFLLSIGRLFQSTNRQSEFSRHSHESRTKKTECERALLSTGENYFSLYIKVFFHTMKFSLMYVGFYNDSFL